MVVLENLSFQETYYHPSIINTAIQRKLISPNKIIQASMIPKVKILFISGPNKGQKFLLEPSIELSGKGKQDFYIGSNNCDISIPSIDVRAVISFRPSQGWILQVLGTGGSSRVFWYLRNQGMPKDETIQYDLLNGIYQSQDSEIKVKC